MLNKAYNLNISMAWIAFEEKVLKLIQDVENLSSIIIRKKYKNMPII